MLSGNGRHRRPRQAPALLVAAGVTGSAIAIPLLGAASANAADGTTWDKVANCESGGSWSENNGNGYYGGLQMSQDEWDKYGGLDYAPSADLASRSQQIAVAEKILDDKGTTPWMTCALISGLTTTSGSTNVDTGLASDSPSANPTDSSDSGSDSDSSSDSSASSGLSDSGTTDSTSSDASGDSSTDSPSPAATDNSAKSDKSTTPSKGNDSVAASPKLDESDNSAQAVGKWSLVDTGALGDSDDRQSDQQGGQQSTQQSAGKHRGASAEENVSPQTYTVRAGDSLASIADSLGFDGGWRALYAENKKVIGADPTQIAAGQTLDVGTEADEK
ncbi:transglycosylase family protein [Streptomyces sp. NBC_00989]|uniref:transglycosylase family protein n=1 Tax=Streptomyces sp. NBC_00989 TaxID=2903705 RepID=UPI0038686B2F|nr:LysM peptidoglycan-binding domain-containing protein [Streptomyces sp. NBC_00989]